MNHEQRRPADTEHRMQCMELWGGNCSLEKFIRMTGVNADMSSRTFGGGDEGGDVYYLTSCASGRISRALLADVSGHGASVAKTAERLRNIMRQHVNVIRQSKLMTHINEEFSNAEIGVKFATAVVATYFLPTKSLTVSIAGHPRPLLYRSENDTWTSFGTAEEESDRLAPALPLGVDSGVAFQTLTVPFQQGDMLLLYTDAFSEAVDGRGELLGTSGLLGLLEECNHPRNAVSWLRDKLSDFSPENLNKDDATAILLIPSGEKVTFWENVAAPFRLLGGVNQVSSSEL